MFSVRWYATAVLVLALAAGGQAEMQVNTYVEHHQTHPAVAMNDDGAFVIVWRSHIADGRGGGLYGCCFDADGAPLSEEFQVNVSEVDVGTWTPAVAIGAGGGFVVAWPAGAGQDSDLVARMFDAGGAATTEELPVAVTPLAAASSPSISMNSSGTFVVVWTNWYGDAYIGQSYAAGRVYDANGTPLGEEFGISELTQQMWPDVAMNDAGRFVVTWIRMGDTYNRPYGEFIMMRQFESDGTPASREVPLTGDLNSRWYGPSVAAGKEGGFVVTWAIGPFPYDICAQPFDAMGVPITPPYLVNTCTAGNQGHPCIATNGDQDYLIVWDCHGEAGSGCRVRGQFCTCDGQVEGDEMLLNTGASGRNWYPDVAMAADGRYVVTWICEDGDGSGYGIFATLGQK